METVKCEVIKDLLPLYVDDVVSKESRELVEEHLDGCTECKAYYESLKGADATVVKNDAADDKKTIQKIRKTINKKRAITICLTAVLLITVGVGFYYMFFVKQSYLPYEETGLYVEDGVLQTKEPYYCYYVFEVPEEDTLYVYITTTAYERNQEQGKVVIVDELYRESITTYDDSEIEEFEKTEFKKVYYISQENVQTLKDIYWESDETEAGIRERIEALQEESFLIWETE